MNEPAKAVIRCSGCEAVHDKAFLACPNCGRCSGCGIRRIEKAEQARNCQECNLPYCNGCGRCHGCGNTRLLDLPACSCGYPIDEKFQTMGNESSRSVRYRTNLEQFLWALWIGVFQLIFLVILKLLGWI